MAGNPGNYNGILMSAILVNIKEIFALAALKKTE
jgi:hypothetical protein